MAKMKWYGLVYYDARGVVEPGFLYADTDEGFVAEYASTWDPRGVFEGDAEPGPTDLPRYEIVPLTDAEANEYERAEAETDNDGVADYETWLSRRMER